MKKIEYAIARFKYSKGDFYFVEIIERFTNYEQASKVFSEKKYADAGSSSWPDSYNYELIDIKDGVNYYHDGGIIRTILD
ncbi:MAG TPA: hypothetical protein PK986_01635 [Spirochaetota bacterium]|nr:hypothetical protein [Spirochaetota bacterium]HQO39145.1 hypothetical protein [Spirochaetota bacterium]